jgi:predicted metal-binding membrane protein
MTAIGPAVGRRQLPLVLPAAIALAWAASAGAELSGIAHLLHHHTIYEGALEVWSALALFFLAWQLMITAMMLPSSLPLARIFAALARGQEHRGTVVAALLGGYALVWTAFGFLALGGDMALHRTMESSGWLEDHEWLIGAGVLALAGAFQFSGLKDRCLDECRHPAAFLLSRYRHGRRAALRIGLSHGVFCLGCCWALMLLMFAAGLANLLWMAGLAAIMVYEKTGRYGRALVPVVGVVLLVWAGLVAAQPAWLPAWASGL